METSIETHIFEEFFCNNAGTGVNGQFHLTDLLVNFLHEVDDKVHQLMLVHLLRMEVGDEEANVVTLETCVEKFISKTFNTAFSN